LPGFPFPGLEQPSSLRPYKFIEMEPDNSMIGFAAAGLGAMLCGELCRYIRGDVGRPASGRESDGLRMDIADTAAPSNPIPGMTFPFRNTTAFRL
jgi:hypothetical protein